MSAKQPTTRSRITRESLLHNTAYEPLSWLFGLQAMGLTWRHVYAKNTKALDDLLFADKEVTAHTDALPPSPNVG